MQEMRAGRAIMRPIVAGGQHHDYSLEATMADVPALGAFADGVFAKSRENQRAKVSYGVEKGSANSRMDTCKAFTGKELRPPE